MVVASRLVEIDHKMTPLMEEELGLTPIHNIGMAEGRWLITMQYPGHREISQAVRLHQGDVLIFQRDSLPKRRSVLTFCMCQGATLWG